MTRKKRKARTKTIIASQCERNSGLILKGTLLAIDPSSGSQSSQPGYALFEKGVLKEMGIVDVGTRYSKGGALASRLFLLRETLVEQFQPDVLAIERCPFGYGNTSAAKLQQVMGCVKSTWDIPCIEVSPSSWKRWTESLERLSGTSYEKRDDMDAAVMGVCVIGHALEVEPDEL